MRFLKKKQFKKNLNNKEIDSDLFYLANRLNSMLRRYKQLSHAYQIRVVEDK